MSEAIKIVFLDSHTLVAGGDINIDCLNRFGALENYGHTPSDQILERCKDAEIVISNKVALDSTTLDQLERLKLIVVAATGFNNIDIKKAAALNVPVCNVVGYSSASVAQHVFAMLLAYLNRVEQYAEESRQGEWSSQMHFSYSKHTIYELNNKTLGIIGLGKIGQTVARIASGFGMKIIASHRHPELVEYDDITNVDQKTLFETADVISLHAPLNDSTHQLINQTTLKLMKNDAILINTARGGLINEKDLSAALKEGEIAAALLDVLSEEPPGKDHILLSSPNCYITPHQAWSSFEARLNLLAGIENNIDRFLAGSPVNVVN